MIRCPAASSCRSAARPPLQIRHRGPIIPQIIICRRGISFARPQPSNSRSSRILRSVGIATVGFSATLVALAAMYPADARWYSLAALRSARTAVACAEIALDYKSAPSKEYPTADEQLAAKKACHQRSANRMLRVCQQNGGIYIKLGQHIAALMYLLPEEYTETMRVLQDRCPQSSMDSIRALIKNDTGQTLEELFEDFDERPLGVASLAQVHKARLRNNGQTVAVKIQHPHLDEYAPIDIAVCGWFAERVRRIFPDFEFDWLAEELRMSLPRELDFEQEAENAAFVSKNFRGSEVVRIPVVEWAKRRLLVMEYIDGAKVDDVAFMREHNINVIELSNELSTCFYKMIFFDGFVHCDPHPGNVFVRPRKPPVSHSILSFFMLRPRAPNFEIVLLDHGLYRHLPDSLRMDYAHLWDALLRGDEPGILHYSHKIFTRPTSSTPSKDNIDHHRLFASMLTGRSWALISSTKNGSGATALASARTEKELAEVQEKAKTGRFFIAISEVLAKLPRELLLLLKTNDLLRAVDDSLGVTSGGSDALVIGMMRRLSLMGWFCAVVIREEALQRLRSESADSFTPIFFHRRFWQAWMSYVDVVIRGKLLEVFVFAKMLLEQRDSADNVSIQL